MVGVVFVESMSECAQSCVMMVAIACLGVRTVILTSTFPTVNPNITTIPFTPYTLVPVSLQPRAQASSHKPYLCRSSIMPSTKKADLIQQLKEHGEEAHDKMTVIEIKARLEVLKGDSPKTEVGTLEARLKEMYTRSRDRKSQFQRFLQDRGITFSEHATVVQMVAAAERQITEEFEVNGAEKMNFGKFSSMTMDNVIEDHPSYAQWCHQTAAESDTASWRLQRFARYMTMKQAKSSIEYQYQQTGTMGHKTIRERKRPRKRMAT